MDAKPLFCASCDAPHDVDLAPDTGTCVICGGPLVEDVSERGLVGAVGQAIVDAVNDGLAKVAVAGKWAPRGGN